MRRAGARVPLTRIGICQAAARRPVRAELVVGGLAPRLIYRDVRSAHVALSAAQMLLLDGDRMDVQVAVGAGCTLRLEDIGGTVAYPRRSRETAGAPDTQWNITAQVETGGTLLWEGLPFVAADDADVVRSTDLQLGAGAVAVLRETLVLGRHGEAGGRIRSLMSIADETGPLLVEDTRIDGARPAPGVLGGHRVMDQVTAAGFRPTIPPGDLLLEEPGAVSRYLGSNTHASPLPATFEAWASQAGRHASHT